MTTPETLLKTLSQEQALDAIESLNPAVNAVLTDIATCRQRSELGDGIPLLVKDCINVAGLPTTHGSALGKNASAATTNAHVVQAAIQAGATVLGKLNLNEYCFGATGENQTFGNCRNPWDTDRITGGSSSGSAASVAAGMTRIALGTDTGGSVRVPAALCGVVGLRPTIGRVSNTGCLEVSAQSDTIGPLAPTVAEAAWLYDAIQGYDPTDPLSIPAGPAALKTLNQGIKGLRVGIVGGYFAEDIQPDITAAMARLARQLEQQGAVLCDVTPDDDEARRQHHAFRFILADVAEARADIASDPERFGQLGREVQRRIELGQQVSGVEYAASVRSLLRLRRWLRNVFDNEADLLLMPTTPTTAPLWKDSTDMVETTRQVARLTYDLGAAGIPSISVPVGTDGKGLPIGAMIAAPWGEDALVFQAAKVAEQVSGFELRPAVFRQS